MDLTAGGPERDFRPRVGPGAGRRAGDGPGDDRLALEVAGLGRWDLDVERGTVSRSPLHDRIFGYPEPPAEWTYRRFLDHVVTEDRDEVDAAFQAAVRDGHDWDVECQIVRADGARRWVWVRGGLGHGDGAGARRMLGVVADVTARKCRAAPPAAESQFERAVAQAPIPALLHAEDGEILQVSQAFCEITGYAAADVPTVAEWTQLAYGDRQRVVRDHIQQLYQAGGHVDDGEYTVRTRSGESRVWAFRSAPLGRDARGRRLVISMAADVTARHQAQRELRRVSAQLLQAEEQERRRLARELHDELGALLTMIQITIRRALPAGSPALADAQALVRTATETVRGLSLELRPSLLDDLGLAPALRQLADRFAARTGIAVDFRSEVSDGDRFSPAVETAAYRVVQEALTNVARHAGADRVQVLCHRDPDRLALHVVDEGRGFDTDRVAEADSGGLAGMRERAGLAGGTCEVTSEPGAGTRVTVSLPVTPRPDQP